VSDLVTCTMVFEIEKTVFKSMNPLNTVTPWGIPYAVSIGDALEEGDRLREALQKISLLGDSNDQKIADAALSFSSC
jgi:hypothetical protein